MEISTLISLCGLLIVLTTLIITNINNKRQSEFQLKALEQKADSDYVLTLEKRLGRTEKDLESCLASKDYLLRRLTELEKRL